MLTLFLVFFSSLRSSFRARAALQAEVLALRHQLLVLQRSTQGRRARFRAVDRIFWVWLSRLWHGWRSRVWIMKAETVIAWNRRALQHKNLMAQGQNLSLKGSAGAKRASQGRKEDQKEGQHGME